MRLFAMALVVGTSGLYTACKDKTASATSPVAPEPQTRTGAVAAALRKTPQCDKLGAALGQAGLATALTPDLEREAKQALARLEAAQADNDLVTEAELACGAVLTTLKVEITNNGTPQQLELLQ